MIPHIDKKRHELGIDRARERVMVDMAARRELSAWFYGRQSTEKFVAPPS